MSGANLVPVEGLKPPTHGLQNRQRVLISQEKNTHCRAVVGAYISIQSDGLETVGTERRYVSPQTHLENHDGSQGEAWIVAYTDRAGKRRMKNFDRKRDADAFHASVSTDLRSGVQAPDSESVMVAEAGRLWLKSCEAARLERATLDYYRQHLELHIIPLVGAVKLGA